MFEEKRKTEKRLNILSTVLPKKQNLNEIKETEDYNIKNFVPRPKSQYYTSEEKQEKIRKHKKDDKVYPNWWWGDDQSECKKEVNRNIKKKDKKEKWFKTRTNTKTSKNESQRRNEELFYSRNSESEYSYVPYPENIDNDIRAHPMIMNKLFKPKYKPNIDPAKFNYKISYDKNLKPELIEKKSRFLDNEESKTINNKNNNQNNENATLNNQMNLYENNSGNNLYSSYNSNNDNVFGQTGSLKLSNIEVTDDMKSILLFYF